MFKASWTTSPKKFKNLYDENREYIRTAIYWMVRDDGVDDIVQEVFIKAWKSRDSFKGDSHVKTWLYRIAMNCSKDYLSKRNRLRDLYGESDEEARVEEGGLIESRELINIGLKVLSPELREKFILHYKLGLTTKEIGEVLQIPEGTVKSQLSKARELFSKALEKEKVMS